MSNRPIRGISFSSTFKGVGQTFNKDNQVSATGFAFDGNGNPTTYAGSTFTYDQENRVTGIGSTLTAQYRSDGLRAWKQNASGKTYFLYDGGEPVVELNGSGTVTAVNVFGQDGLVARDASGAITEYDFDQQGNVAHRTDSGGRTINASTYQAYGVESTVGLTDSDPFGYNARWGYYLDRETGLYLCQHRYYDPATGRWINRDPIGVVGGVDLYQYTNSSPTLINDSSGLATWVQVGSFLGGYSHAYIQFDKPCMGSTSFGFWPASGSAPYGSSGGSLGVGSSSGSSAGLGSSGESSGGSSSSSASSSAGDSFSAGSSSSSSSASSSAGGLSQPGIIKHNDPHASDPPCEGFWSKLVGAHHDRAQNNDDAFERALCDCIKNSISHTPRYVFGKYVCGSWVAQMWACAKRKVNGG